MAIQRKSSATASTSSKTSTRIPVARRGGKAASTLTRRQQLPTPDDSQSPDRHPAQQDSSEDDDGAAIYVASSRTPISASSKRRGKEAAIDVKGKGKARAESVVEEPEKPSLMKRDVFDEDNSDQAPEAEDAMPPPRSRRTAPTTGTQTPNNFRAGTPRLAPVPSSSVLRTSNRARTASVAPGGPVFSSVKPVPLRTVIRTSPPRYTISDSESSSDSDFILKPGLSNGKRKRKAAVGEFEWDEQSRACIPKRERSRSRSVAFALLAKQEATEDEGDASVGQPTDAFDELDEDDRSHIQASTSNILGGLSREEDEEADSFQHTTRRKVVNDDAAQEVPFEGNDFCEDDVPLRDEDADILVPYAEEPTYDFGHNDGPEDDSDSEVDNGNESSHRVPIVENPGRYSDDFERSIRRIGSPVMLAQQELGELVENSGDGDDQAAIANGSPMKLGDGQMDLSILAEKDIVPVSVQAESSGTYLQTKLEHQDGSKPATPEDVAQHSKEGHPERYPKMRCSPAPAEDVGITEVHGTSPPARFSFEAPANVPVANPEVPTAQEKLSALKPTRTARFAITEPARAVSELPPSSPPPLPQAMPSFDTAISMDTDSSDEEMPYVPLSAQKRMQPFSPAPRPSISKNNLSPEPHLELVHSPPLQPPASTSAPAPLSLGRSTTPLGQLPQETLQQPSTPLASARAPSNPPRSPLPFLNLPMPSYSPARALSPGRSATPLSHLSPAQLYSPIKAVEIPHITPIKLRALSPALQLPSSSARRSASPAQQSGTGLANSAGSPFPTQHLISPAASSSRHRLRSPSPLSSSVLPGEYLPVLPRSPSLAPTTHLGLAARLKSLSPQPSTSPYTQSQPILRSPQAPTRLVAALQSTPKAHRLPVIGSPAAAGPASIHQMLEASPLPRQSYLSNAMLSLAPQLAESRASRPYAEGTASLRAGIQQLRQSLSVEPVSPRPSVAAIKQEEDDSPAQSLAPALEVRHQTCGQPRTESLVSVSLNGVYGVEKVATHNQDANGYRVGRAASRGPSQPAISRTPLQGILSSPRPREVSPKVTFAAAATIHETVSRSDRYDTPPRALDSGSMSHQPVSAEPAQDEAQSDTDSEAEALEVQRSLSRSRSLSKSPAPFRHILANDDVQLSPNVTVRRARSRSRSTNSTMSIRSKPNTPQRPTVAGRKLSFADLGTLDSSPLSVAASVSQKSFEALDTSSEDEEDEDEDEVPRPSPAKQIAAAQMRQSYQEGLSSGSSSDNDDVLKSALTSSPGRLLNAQSRFSHALAQALTSTPAKLLGALALSTAKKGIIGNRQVTASTPAQISDGVSVLSARPLPSPAVAVIPRCSSEPQDPASNEGVHDSLFVEPGSPTEQHSTSLDPKPAPAEIEPYDHAEDVSVVATDRADAGDLSMLSAGLTSADTSAILDEARPRSDLIVPPLASRARPAAARGRPRAKPLSQHPKGLSPVRSVLRIAAQEDISPASITSSRRARSLSQQGSAVSSSTSAIVQVSSADPKMAARAAAILKVHHHYIQEGVGLDSIAEVATNGTPEDGEALLDELLREAEMEVSMRVPKVEEHSQEMLHDTSADDLPNATSQQSFNLSARRIVRSQPNSRLGVWTRQDWRSLEQSFIDERRRTAMAKEPLAITSVIRNYLEGEEMTDVDCVGEWDPEKLEIRVQALLARKEQKAMEERSKRERSISCISSIASRAPSEFFAHEDSRMLVDESLATEAPSNETFLKLPGATQPSKRRYARSAEPTFPSALSANNYSHLNRGVLPRVVSADANATAYPVRRAVSLNSIPEAPGLRTAVSVSDRVSKLYPSLLDLTIEMRPKKQMPIRGGRIAAAVSRFERLEAEQSMLLSAGYYMDMKRKATDGELREDAASKRQRT